MTALAGYWHFGDGDAARSCARMLRAQSIYGPDAPASWSRGPIAMGRRLWTLLPEDRVDRGPIVSAAGTLVADVRLDDRAGLADQLGMRQADAARLSDAGLVMKALERWGEAAVERLYGDFALAWWDAAKERLVLARDILGQKPLHYHRGDGFLAFASMPKGLHCLPEVPYAPDRATIADFLALLPETGAETFFERIEKVPAGAMTIVTRGGAVETHSYWRPDPPELRLASGSDYEDAMRAEVERSVATRLRGTEERVAAHLSAGLDSPVVAATAARLMAGGGGRVIAFTAAPREGYRPPASDRVLGDEWPLAAEVAALHPNIEHVRIGERAGAPTSDLGRYFALFERPFLNLCNGVWMTATLEEAKKRRLGVLLTGVYGNATFSYDGMHHLHALARGGRLLALAGAAARLKRGGTRLGTIASQVLGPMLPHPVWRAVARLRGAQLDIGATSLLRKEHAAQLRIEERAAARGFDLHYQPRGDSRTARLSMLRRVDQGNYKKGTLAGWGVDLRDPLGDRRLIEFCLSVPPEIYIAGGVPRALARRSFADRLPAALLEERRKGLQAIDWHEGLTAVRGELMEEAEAIADCPAAAEAVDAEAMRRLVEDWPEGRWHEREVVGRYRLALLRGVSAGRFLRQAMGTNR